MTPRVVTLVLCRSYGSVIASSVHARPHVAARAPERRSSDALAVTSHRAIDLCVGLRSARSLG
jgi:hypothetical protein